VFHGPPIAISKLDLFSNSNVDSAFTIRAVDRERKVDRLQYASRDDIEKALELLSPEDEKQLERFSRYKVRGLGRAALGRDHEDLLGEAIKSTWTGAEESGEGRRWRKAEISLVQHLLGAVRSISSHWKESANENEAWLESEVADETDAGELLSPIRNFSSGAPNQEREVSAKEQLGAIYDLFTDDYDAALVLEGIKEGWTAREIIEHLGLPKNRYEAAIKRIRYKVK
jgi:hypothetical protein